MEKLKKQIKKIIKDYKIQDGIVRIKTKVLSAEEAIGNPEHNDYPIQKGRERLMQADFNGAYGVAFTDMFGDYNGSLYEIVNMELKNNFRRAIFISTINAVLSCFGLVDKTSHCRNEGPVNCRKRIVEFMRDNFGNPKIFQAGLQPRFVEVLSKEFEFRVTDMDKDNIGKKINGVTIGPAGDTEKNIEWCDVVFATGSTFVNETYEQLMMDSKPTVFYGVTCAGATYLLNLKRYCPEGI
ncbi:MAG: hypothetical protein KAI43_11150 [Candidatus Aureabacteria bacterium]|nr:hypothetical protein [Candidatus Auribacterota bacterium]